MVSVIIPNYCHSAYLEQRIESVLNQSHRDMEVIILDDNSTDRSMEIIERYASNPLVSHVVSNDTNSGSPFRQWQKGFSLARGEYIWIAESDDYSDPDFLRIMVGMMETNPSLGMCFCESHKVGPEDNSLRPTPLPGDGDYTIWDGKRFISRCMLRWNSIYNAGMALFRRDLLDGMPDDYTKYRSAGDKLFWIYAIRESRVCHIYKQYNYFRQHGAGVTSRSRNDGTTFMEDLMIIKHLYDTGLIGMHQRMYACAHHLDEIERFGGFLSEDTKSRVAGEWERYCVNRGLGKLLLRLHNRFGI